MSIDDPTAGAAALTQALSGTPLLDALPVAVVATDLTGRIFYWNAAAERLYGFTAEDMHGANVMDLLVGPVERPSGAEIMGVVLAGGTWSGQFPVRCADGVTRPIRVTDSPLVIDGRVVGIVGLGEDVSAVTAAREDLEVLADRLSALAGVIARLAAAPDVAAITDVVVSHAADAVGAAVASLSLLADDETLTLAGIRGAGADTERRWATYPLSTAVPAAEAVRTGRRVVLLGSDAVTAEFPLMADELPEDRSIVCFPIAVGSRRLGAIGLTFPGRRIPDDRAMEFLGTLADACAQALDRLNAVDQAADRATKLAFLADASSELASSLDYGTTLSNVARLAVPTLADWCAVQVLEDGRLRTLAVAHVDPAKVELAWEMHERYPPDMAAETGAPKVVRTGESEFYPEIPDELLVAGSRDEEQLRISRELQLRSALVVPLAIRGQVLGVITLVHAESGRRYRSDDLAFAEDLARRAAAAIDNSQLYSETREAAVRLQRAVLPEESPRVTGWEIAALYRPAGRTDVGGDFYDAIGLPDGRLVAVMGDVMGRGVAAAAAMAQMRAAIRAYVAVDAEPSGVLTKLEKMFATYPVAQLVTLLYVVCDSQAGELQIANAGHLSPLLLRDGVAQQLVTHVSMPLGAGHDERPVTRVPFHPGDLLLALTDGLVERRGEDIDMGLGRVIDTLPMLAAAADLDTSLAEMVDELQDESRADDVTALVVRRPPGP